MHCHLGLAWPEPVEWVERSFERPFDKVQGLRQGDRRVDRRYMSSPGFSKVGTKVGSQPVFLGAQEPSRDQNRG
jgi:hypothetical protein